MEKTMLNKYFLIGILVITGAMANMAFVSASNQPKLNNAVSITDTNFRIAHMWNGIYIPSMDVTGLITPPGTYVPSIADTNFRIAHMWNGIFIPSMDVTGLLNPPGTFNQFNAVTSSQTPRFYEYGPAIAATGLARPGVTSFQTPHSYEYGPASSATGFARPGVTGLQPHLKLNSGH
jgi:hypothetical protein